MKVYAISGLGADKRVFDFLELNFHLIHIDWIQNKPKESIENYALRLSKKIDSSEEFMLIGLSFGGLIATEISKILKTKKLILISSVSVKSEIPLLYRLLGKTRIMNIIPVFFLEKSNMLLTYMFGTNKKQLLTDIIEDSSAQFSKWCIIELMNWKNTVAPKNIFKINGEKDKLLPSKNSHVIIKNGGHLMIVDKADELSKILNQLFKS